jgi:hypothetical protein
MRKLIITLLIISLASCSLPFTKKKSDQAPEKAATTTSKASKGERVDSGSEPKPGDIKLVEGVEYIYARNRRYNAVSSEPEYIWYRKDQYSPGLFETLKSGMTGTDKKERTELEKRLAKLEGELKSKGTSQGQPVQVVYAGQPGLLSGLPLGVGALPPSFVYPSPKMKRRVLVLPLADQSNYKDEQLNDLATKRLISRLENSGTVICVEARSLNIQGDPTTPKNMGDLATLYGVQAVLKGTLSDVYTTTSRPDGRENREISMAISRIAVEIYNTETASLLRQLNARSPFSLSREQGEMSPEKAKLKSIDLAIELLADDVLKVLLNLDWHARIANIENDKIYINAGRMSGLEKGDILEVYTAGDQIIDKTTNIPLGRVKGDYKGELEVFEVFGVDAAWAKVKKMGSFSPTDLVYLKK